MDSNSKTTIALVSITGPDKVGIISDIAGRLFDLGVNFVDTTFAVLGGNAEFSAICELQGETDISVIKSELAALGVLSDAEISVSYFSIKNNSPASKSITHNIKVYGGDSPGLLARLCEVFQQFNANIVQLNSERHLGNSGDEYIITASVSIPQDATDSCLAHIANTAGELGLSCDWEEIKQ
ncbi:MAG: amino acid-binding protein [Rhodospirillaceae bacterium]|nr:amino acid-binding protein [Rhodospirillaceae bacterium]